MSYNRPPPQAPQGYPPQGHSPYPPQQGYGGPPHPNAPNYPPPQQGGYHPPQGPPPGHPQHGPPQGYPQHGAYPPPQQGGYGQPPPGPPGGPYGHAPPPGPPPGHYAGGPPGPPGGPGYGGYGGGAPPPAAPSLGYIPNQTAQGNFVPQAEELRRAMKGFGTDDAALIRVLARLDPLQMAAVRETYTRHLGRDLYKDVKSETSGYFEQGLLAIIDGPLVNDADLVREAVKGLGTKEWLLNDVLLGRSNADMREIKNAFHRKFNKDLDKEVADDLSAETKAFFARITSATRHEESHPINHETIERDVNCLHGSTAGHTMNHVAEVCALFARSSDNELRAINQLYHQKYKVELEKHLSKEFSGHMKAAMIYMLRTATDPAYRDAAALEECMAGAGTKDCKLVIRIVRLHWNKAHVDQVKKAYFHHYKKDLRDRVKGETSGDYQKLMLALLE